MDFTILNNIEQSLWTVECKIYSLEIKFDNDTKISIEKKPDEPQKKIGFSEE